jgi:alpha-glucosidase
MMAYCLLLWQNSAFPQARDSRQPAYESIVHSVGPLISYKTEKYGISGNLSGAVCRIRAYSDNIIRVQVSRNRNIPDSFYALADSLAPACRDLLIRDKGKTIELSTNALQVIIEKEPTLRIIFKNKKGEIINEDMPGDGFGTTFTGEKLSIYKRLQKGERFVGLGEVLGGLDKRGMGFTLNNTDTYKYGDPRLSMYTSIPFYIGIEDHGLYGLFFNNSYKSFFNFGLSTPGFSSINAEGGNADYFFMYDTTVGGILEHYTSITGRMPLPPLWSIGYNQSRCSYYPQSKVEWIAETFRKKQIPVDCIVLDADYLQDYEPFRINKSRFPDMPALADTLRKMNIELTASVNPGIKLDSSYAANADGIKKDVFLKYPNGSLFVSEIAPSLNHFVDFTNPKARAWWIENMKFLPDNGIHGYWNDMNEPAVAGSYLPDNLVFDFDGRKANALEGKNVYGMQMARSSYESALKYGGGRRPFVLTRSGFAGVQRYAAVWSGDNTAKDEYLLGGILLNSQLGLSGIPFVGPDLGGYIGDGNKELYERWIEAGIFSPFLRNHREFFGAASEPWAYGEEAEAISKTFIGFRYRLLPYIYSAFSEASHTGMPIARSLCINYPYDPKVYDNIYQYQFLFGGAIMVVPVTPQEKIKKIYLPKGEWYNLYTDELLQGGQELMQTVPAYRIPLYIKASGIIPMESLVQSTKDKPCDTLSVHIYYGAEQNTFLYYEDDGNSFAYKKGDYCKRDIVFDPAKKQIRFTPQEGSYASGFKKLRLILHGFPEQLERINCNGRETELAPARVKLLDPLKELEDFYDKDYYKSLRQAEHESVQKTILIDNSKEAITINW